MANSQIYWAASLKKADWVWVNRFSPAACGMRRDAAMTYECSILGRLAQAFVSQQIVNDILAGDTLLQACLLFFILLLLLVSKLIGNTVIACKGRVFLLLKTKHRLDVSVRSARGCLYSHTCTSALRSTIFTTATYANQSFWKLVQAQEERIHKIFVPVRYFW